MHGAAEDSIQLSLPLAVLTVCREMDQGEKILDQARRYLSSYAIETNFYAITGHAYESIPNDHGPTSYHLDFMGSHGHGRIIELVLGSTTEYVLRNAPCPVFLNR